MAGSSKNELIDPIGQSIRGTFPPPWSCYQTIFNRIFQRMLLFSPEDVEDLSVGVNPDEDVWHSHKLEVGLFRVGEENLKM